jgi:hypothetical protein
LQYIVISYAKNTKVRDILKVAFAFVVRYAPVVMALAVKLDHQGVRGAIEIDRVRAGWMLTSKRDSSETEVSKQAP